MNLSEFKEALFRALLEVQGLRPPAKPHRLGPAEEGEAPEATSRTRELVERLLAEAFKNGFPDVPDYKLRVTSLSGGLLRNMLIV